jgi:hypothetical protein
VSQRFFRSRTANNDDNDNGGRDANSRDDANDNRDSAVGGNPKIRIRSPNTRKENMQTFESEAQMTQEETKNPLKTAHTSKVVNPFTPALAPPFIGRQRDFYIPKIPSNLGNIPSVNMYMNAFYIP